MRKRRRNQKEKNVEWEDKPTEMKNGLKIRSGQTKQKRTSEGPIDTSPSRSLGHTTFDVNEKLGNSETERIENMSQESQEEKIIELIHRLIMVVLLHQRFKIIIKIKLQMFKCKKIMVINKETKVRKEQEVELQNKEWKLI